MRMDIVKLEMDLERRHAKISEYLSLRAKLKDRAKDFMQQGNRDEARFCFDRIKSVDQEIAQERKFIQQSNNGLLKLKAAFNVKHQVATARSLSQATNAISASLPPGEALRMSRQYQIGQSQLESVSEVLEDMFEGDEVEAEEPVADPFIAAMEKEINDELALEAIERLPSVLQVPSSSPVTPLKTVQ